MCTTWCAKPQLPMPMQRVLWGGNQGAVDGFGDWDRAEDQGVAPLILCILHVLHLNTSVLPSSRSVAEYNSSSSNIM